MTSANDGVSGREARFGDPPVAPHLPVGLKTRPAVPVQRRLVGRHQREPEADTDTGVSGFCGEVGEAVLHLGARPPAMPGGSTAHVEQLLLPDRVVVDGHLLLEQRGRGPGSGRSRGRCSPAIVKVSSPNDHPTAFRACRAHSHSRQRDQRQHGRSSVCKGPRVVLPTDSCVLHPRPLVTG